MKKRIAIDIFSGAGGLSIGAKWAGIESKLAI
jgi:site-specific DNA-cytosine methylase